MYFRYIFIKGKLYFYYENYETWGEAIREAKQKKQEYLKEGVKIKHWIQPYLHGTIFQTKRYALYLTKVQKVLWQ